MNPIQQATAARKKKIALGLGIVFGGLWLLMICYLMLGDAKNAVSGLHISPAVHPASPVASGSTPSPTFHSTYRQTSLFHHHAVSVPQWSYVQQAPASGGATIHIYQTSNASVQNIGGGGSGGGIATTSGGHSGGRGIHSTAVSYGGSMIALASSVPLASPGADNAASIASTVEEIIVSPERHIRTTTGDPTEPFLDPVGDVTWGLMLVLTIGWCVRVRRKRQPACK